MVRVTILILFSLPVVTATAAETPAVRAAQAQMLMRINPLLDGYEIRIIPFPNKWHLEGAVSNAIEADLARKLAELFVPPAPPLSLSRKTRMD